MTALAIGIVLGVVIAWLDHAWFNDTIEKWLNRQLEKIGL